MLLFIDFTMRTIHNIISPKWLNTYQLVQFGVRIGASCHFLDIADFIFTNRFLFDSARSVVNHTSMADTQRKMIIPRSTESEYVTDIKVDHGTFECETWRHHGFACEFLRKNQKNGFLTVRTDLILPGDTGGLQ
ncbi:hypothetical protein CCR75_008394 [Bremia lactucae]|uniref:Uncharacterized protein n=1 Tax=Bremia lactucae TaxID=4779 RepID=A0A976FH50_BRELC|nr:hypothetical protein CCR75_008394 [Bremia lactucae]